MYTLTSIRYQRSIGNVAGSARGRRLCRQAAIVGLVLVAITSVAKAAKPWRPFLDGLRDRGMYDIALVYLDRMAVDPKCPADLRKVLDFEAGTTLLGDSSTTSLLARRERLLDKARSRFKKFVSEHPDHPLAPKATSYLAKILVEQGRNQARLAERPATLPEHRDRLLAKAREYYTEAKAVFDEARRHYLDALKQIGDSSDEATIEKRELLETELLEARFSLATIEYETARTHPSQSAQRRKGLVEAANAFQQLYEQYVKDRESPILGGYFARLWQGRCYRQLGQYKKAISIFSELVTQPGDAPAIRRLVNRTTVQILQTYNDPKVHEYNKAIEAYETWDKSATHSDRSGAEGSAIRFLAAEAYLHFAKGLAKGDPGKKRRLKKARGLFRSVSRTAGEYQAKAKTSLLDPLLTTGIVREAEPTTFAEARNRAEAAKDRIQAAELQQQLSASQDNTEVSKEYQKEIADARDEAIRYYRMALSMTDKETPIADINFARYYLAVLYLQRGDRYDAAVLGEFIARHYPETALARQAAKIAMVAYSDLYHYSTTASDRQFAQRKLIDVAGFVTKRWPTGQEAADAWIMLIHSAIVDGNLETAVGYLDRLSKDSPRRGEAEVRIGLACWKDWAQAMQAESKTKIDQKTMQKKLDQAEQLLASGVKRMAAEGQINSVLVAGVHSLSQILLQQNRPEEALDVLEHPQYGALTLVRTKHPATTQAGYATEIYKTALRACVAAQHLDKAEAMMNSLEKQVATSGDSRAASRLTKVYLGLSRELQNTLKTLRQQGHDAELAKVSHGFEQFLNHIAQRKQGNTFASLVWVAGTLADMAEQQNQSKKSLSPAAENYYRKAIDIYTQILDRCQKDRAFAPNQAAIDGVRVRLAQCRRRLGQYGDAIKLLVRVLQRRNRMVDAQLEAAKIYEDWGEQSGDGQKFLNAMAGAYPARRKDGTRANVIWGWGKLANLLLRSQSRTELFHEARYHLARCRYEYALTLTGKKKADMLALAEKDISVTRLLSPTLGGKQQQELYHMLLKKIQSALGKEPVGLTSEKRNHAK